MLDIVYVLIVFYLPGGSATVKSRSGYIISPLAVPFFQLLPGYFTQRY